MFSFKSKLFSAGSTLFTFNAYSVMPGAIFYDVAGADDVAELASAAAAGIFVVASLNVVLTAQAAVPAVVVATKPLVTLGIANQNSVVLQIQKDFAETSLRSLAV